MQTDNHKRLKSYQYPIAKNINVLVNRSKTPHQKIRYNPEIQQLKKTKDGEIKHLTYLYPLKSLIVLRERPRPREIISIITTILRYFRIYLRVINTFPSVDKNNSRI